MDIKYIRHPIVVGLIGSLIYYIIESFDCYINARKTSSLNRRTVVVFVILTGCLYFILYEDKTPHSEVFTDIGNF
jgi:hypothetical protein